MAFPLILIAIATSAAVAMAYGVHPDLAQFAHGLMLIMLARRLMWLLVAISMLACIALIGLVISGKRRVPWLIGLAPVLALFFHRFGPTAPGPNAVIESATFISADDAGAPEAGDFVVGLLFADHAYAFPYRAIFDHPIIGINDYDQRMLLVWSPYANRAIAVELTHEMHLRDLELVSSPADASLIFDRRLGQFFSGVTGRQINEKPVIGFGNLLPSAKVPWSKWKSSHPDTKVLNVAGDANSPARPILPAYMLRVPPVPDIAMPIAMIATTQPAAIANDAAISDAMNIQIGDTRVLLCRDDAGSLRAFDRHVKEDLFLTFESARANIKRHSTAAAKWDDVDTQSFWSRDGLCVDGPMRGSQLKRIGVDENLYWGVMKFWYPSLQMIDPTIQKRSESVAPTVRGRSRG